MGTGYSTPAGQISSTGSPPFDPGNTLATSWTSYTTNFKASTTGYSNTDIGAALQPLYDNPFYTNTLLCSPSAAATGYYAGFNDLNVLFAKFNSVYASLSTYNITTAQITNVSGLKTTNSGASPTCSALYGANTTPSPPYTYQWNIIATYAATTYPINPNTSILTPTAAFTRFSQMNDGGGWTKQYAQCTVTDSLGRKGYSKVLLINFI